MSDAKCCMCGRQDGKIEVTTTGTPVHRQCLEDAALGKLIPRLLPDGHDGGTDVIEAARTMLAAHSAPDYGLLGFVCVLREKAKANLREALARYDESMRGPCLKCGGTGTIETGNNDLPCDCPAGDIAFFNEAGVDDPVTGAEVRRHFLNGSPEPIEGDVRAADLPGRRQE